MLRSTETLLVSAFLLAVLSVPLAWLTNHTRIHNASDLNDQVWVHTFTHLYGTNGSLNVYLTIPFWFISVLICIIATLFAADNRRLLTVPIPIAYGLVVATFLLLLMVPFFTYASNGLMRVDTGWFLAVAGTVLLTMAYWRSNRCVPQEGG